MTWSGTYRGVTYTKRTESGTGTGAVVYEAVLDGRRIASYTLNGIRCQIGRVLNGLDPADCNICRHCIQPTMINPRWCDYFSRACDPGTNFECAGFQPRR